MKNTKNTLIHSIKITILIIIIILTFLTFPKLNQFFKKENKLYISEIVANNTYTFEDNYGEYSDYIEIYNGYDKKINLSGYSLSDSESNLDKWTFPDIDIESNEYIIVYASGKDICKEKDKCHTNFKLSNTKEVVILSDKDENIISKVEYSSLKNDMAFGYLSDEYKLLDNPTPGKENLKEFEYSNISNNELYINEYIIYNQRTNYDGLGYFSDYVELYNNSKEDLFINNIFLSDDLNDLMKYKLPSITIKKDQYLIIYLNGQSFIKDNQIYANFKLSDNDKYLIISNGKDIIDKVEIVELIDNVSYGRIDDKWFYFTKPTPGSVNNTLSFDKINDIK